MQIRTPTAKLDSAMHETSARPLMSWRCALLLWLGSAILLAAVNQYRNGPATLADELGYLGVARWLAGAGPLPNMVNASFYHFGYSFLIAPAFWLGGNPVSAYKWVMVINCMLAATVAPLSYAFARKFFSIGHRLALFLAAIAMIYPANAAQTNFAWSENALPALMLCWAMALILAHERPTPARIALLALIPVALFFVHPRMLGIELVTFLYLASASVIRKANRWWYVTGCAAMLLMHALVARALSYVRHLAYGTIHGSVSNFMHDLSQVLSRGMKLPAAASGQIAYLSYGSQGLIIIGILALVVLSWQIYRQMRREHSMMTSWLMNPFVILALGIASIFAASAIAMSSGVRPDHWLYGRYVDAASPILLIAGTLSALDRQRIRALAPWLVMVLCFAITLWFSYAAITQPQEMVYNNIPTLAPLIRNLRAFGGSTGIEFSAIMLLVATPALLFAAAGKRAVAPIIAVYVLTSIITIVEWPRNLVGHDAYPAPVRQIRAEIASRNLTDSNILVYRDSFSDPSYVAMFFRMQYFLDKNPIVLSGGADSAEGCPRIGTAKDLASGGPAIVQPIHLTSNIIFWIPRMPSGSARCK